MLWERTSVWTDERDRSLSCPTASMWELTVTKSSLNLGHIPNPCLQPICFTDPMLVSRLFFGACGAIIKNTAAQPPSSAARCEERERRRKEKGREGEERGEHEKQGACLLKIRTSQRGRSRRRLSRTGTRRACHGAHTRAHNSEKRYDRPHVATHL